MIITGAFLAEAAAEVDNKLHVWGGVLSEYMVDADRVARFVLVILTQAETGNTDRGVDIEISPPTGDEPIRMRLEVPEKDSQRRNRVRILRDPDRGAVRWPLDSCGWWGVSGAADGEWARPPHPAPMTIWSPL